MRNTAVLFAGMMVASVAFAGTNDPMAEERFRMKYGRYTPAEEARSAARSEVIQDVAGACCRKMHGAATASVAASEASGPGGLLAAKVGRLTPQREARKRKVDAELAAHVKKCVEIGQCERVHGATAKAATVISAPTDAEGRLRAKYGLTAPSQAHRVDSEQEQLVASADLSGCDHECCTHGE